MDKIGHGKWGGWIVPLGVLLRLFTVITAQPGFLSISCGGKTDHTAENNITWVTDAGYIDVGQRADIGNASALGSYLHSLRYFPKPLNKSCYQLHVTPNAPYLLRLWFVAGNFSLATQGFSFVFSLSIETVDILATQEVTILDISEPIYYEFIFVTSGSVLYICLVRTLSTDDPFISAIELRRLQDGMYQSGIGVGGSILVLQSRYDVGGNSVVRSNSLKFFVFTY
jgi:hypothetical protein